MGLSIPPMPRCRPPMPPGPPARAQRAALAAHCAGCGAPNVDHGESCAYCRAPFAKSEKSAITGLRPSAVIVDEWAARYMSVNEARSALYLLPQPRPTCK
jgi:hypothetical protein